MRKKEFMDLPSWQEAIIMLKDGDSITDIGRKLGMSFTHTIKILDGCSIEEYMIFNYNGNKKSYYLTKKGSDMKYFLSGVYNIMNGGKENGNRNTQDIKES